jgi:hypothetical protein
MVILVWSLGINQSDRKPIVAFASHRLDGGGGDALFFREDGKEFSRALDSEANGFAGDWVTAKKFV